MACILVQLRIIWQIENLSVDVECEEVCGEYDGMVKGEFQEVNV